MKFSCLFLLLLSCLFISECFNILFVVMLVRNVGKTISEEYQFLVEYEYELMKVRKINTSKIAFNGIVAFVSA